ncbi:MAG: Na/Pi symporter [Xanthobacteraceae bacterium]
MSTTISILGGVGLFLLGMTVMTEGLKALAGSSLRTVLGKAAATPLSGAFWGAIVTLLVQSSSATTMTTIGLVSAGLPTFPQGLGLVFGANVGTTGTGWLVALIGVRVSLSSYALPMIFVGALVKLLGRGRISAAGAAIAGFALVLFGLTTLQQGMGGLAEQLHPSNLPAVLGAPGVGWVSGSLGLLTLVVVGLVMTAVMQSSTAAIAVTLSAFYAGAVGLDQGCALIIGQNIGTATSSAMAAIGASTTARRLAVAYVLFKVIAALIALALFPITIPLIIRASSTVDGVTLLAAYHRAYNVIGVLVLMPMIDWFTRFVERLLPDRTSPLTRCLDPAALANTVVAAEAVRRTVGRAIESICGSINAALAAASNRGGVQLEKGAASVTEAAEALQKALEFMSDVSGPPETDDEQRRVTSTLHALDHATRLAEIAGLTAEFRATKGGAEDVHAAQLCAEAMQSATLAAGEVVAHSAALGLAAPIPTGRNSLASPDASAIDDTPAGLVRLEQSASALRELRLVHRSTTLKAVATGELTADEAILRVDMAARFEALARHAWRSLAHLAGRGG